MAVELATAYVSLIPSAKGIVGNIAKELAPVEGAAAATGLRAGSALGGGISSSLKSVLGSLPTASLGPVGGLLGAGLVAGFGAALIGIGKEFGSARRQIIQETGQTGAALSGTFDTVKRVFAEVPASLHEVTTAVDLLRQRGAPLGDTLDTLAKQEVELAKVTKTDLGTNVETTTALFAKYNVALKDQPAALDAIFKASQIGGKGVGELTDSMRTGAAALTQFGFNISQSAALIASLEKAGVNVQPALAGLRKGFATLAQAGQDPKKALKDLIDEFSNGTPPAKAMADAMKLFGTRAGTELATAIQKGNFNVKDLLKTITDGKGGILDTADKTRTLAEQFEILKNQASLALEPLASSVWAQVKTIIADIIPPARDLALAIGQIAKEVAPAAAVLGGGLLVALKGGTLVIGAFAQGLSTTAEVLSHVPAPVIAAAGALVALHVAINAIANAGGISGIASFFADLNPVTAGLVVAAAAVTALGIVVKLFGGGASAASKEAKDLTKALFDSSTAAGLFKSGITSASTGFATFLANQDAAGKLKNLNKALDESGATLKDVANAVTGTAGDFESLKSQMTGIGGLSEKERKGLDDLSSAIGTSGDHFRALSGDERDHVRAVLSATKALDQQRDAFIKSADGELVFANRSGDLSDAQFAAAQAIAHATTGTRGYGAALDFANAAIAENVAKTTQQQVALISSAAGFSQFKSDIISGAIGTNDAATAASRFKISLDAAKQVISDTSAALKTFVDQGVAGFPSSTDAVNTWAQNLTSAFQAVADSAGKPAKEVLKAKDDLLKALDPAQVVAQVQAQAVQIANFQTNILKLVGNFPNAVRALLSNPDKTSAAQFAQSLVNNPAIAAAFDSAQLTIQGKTAALKALLSGPLAQQFLAGAQADGAAITQGITETTQIAAPVQNETQKALTVLRQKEAFSAAAGDTAGAASFAFQARMLLANSAGSETSKATAAVTAGQAPLAAAAGGSAKLATGTYASNLPIAGVTAAAITESQSAWNGQVTIDTANAARAAGRVVGFQFDKGLQDGIRAGQGDVVSSAIAVAQAAVAGARGVKGFHTGSPSKVGIEIGGQFVQGIVIGLSRTNALRAQAASLASTVVSNIIPGFNDLASLDAATKKLKELVDAQTAQQASTAATDAATAALQALVSTAVNALPTAQAAISTFSSGVVSAMQQVATAQTVVTKAQQKFAADQSKLKGAVVEAQNKLEADLAGHASQRQIFLDQDKINKAQHALTVQTLLDTKTIQDATKGLAGAKGAVAAASDPAAFIRNIQGSTKNAAQFMSDIQKLIGEGLPLIAAELAKQGPDVARKLADNLAAHPAQAKLAEAALKQSQTFADTFSATMTKLFGGTVSTQAASVGAQVGDSLVNSAAGSITDAGDVLWTALSKPFDGKKITVPANVSNAIKVATHAGTQTQTSSTPSTFGPFHFEIPIQLLDGSIVHASATLPAGAVNVIAQRARVVAQSRAR